MIFFHIILTPMICTRIISTLQESLIVISIRIIAGQMIFKGTLMRDETEMLREIGYRLEDARRAGGLTQEQVADLAGITRPRYRDIEKGTAAARATTLINIARALGLEMMLVPQAMVPAVNALLRPQEDDDLPAFAPQPDDGH